MNFREWIRFMKIYTIKFNKKISLFCKCYYVIFLDPCHIKSFPPSDQSNFYFQKRSRKLRDTPKSLKSAAFGFLWKVQIYIFLNLTLHIKSLKYFFEVSFQKMYLSLMEEKITFAFISLSLRLFSTALIQMFYFKAIIQQFYNPNSNFLYQQI